jgi:hypothetical protein
MAEVLYLSRYDRHCLDKLLGTSTEARLRDEGHVFVLSDGSEYDPGNPTYQSRVLEIYDSSSAKPAESLDRESHL